MKADEVDKIIAEAVAESKGRKHKHPNDSRNKILAARKWLNGIFMAAFVVAILIYFLLPGEKTLFYSIGFGALLLKIVEFFLRWMF